MKKFIFALIFSSLATSASATGWVCTRDATFVQPSGYFVLGTCVGNGAYTTGGDTIDGTGGAGTAAVNATNANIAFCGASSRVLKHAVISAVARDGGGTSALVGFDHVNNRMVANGLASGAIAGQLMDQLAATQTLTSARVQFFAVCQ